MDSDFSNFIDPTQTGGYSKVEGRSLKDVIVSHIDRIIKSSSVNFIKGYWSYNLSKIGGQVTQSKIWISDTREVYSNCVDVLHDILLSHFDKDMKQISKEHDTALTKLEKETEDRDTLREEKRLLKRLLFQQLIIFIERSKFFSRKEIRE